MPARAGRARAKRGYDMTTRALAAAATRERMMRAMLKLGMELHYEDITLEAIAREAGVSKQTILLHFGSKDGLLEAMVDWWEPQEISFRHLPSGDVDEAADVICRRYDAMGAATLRFLAIEDRFPAIQKLTTVGRASHRTWVELTFGAAIHATGKARERRITQLIVVFDVYTWHLLRRTLDASETRRAMAELARAVLRDHREGSGEPQERADERSKKGGRR